MCAILVTSWPLAQHVLKLTTTRQLLPVPLRAGSALGMPTTVVSMWMQAVLCECRTFPLCYGCRRCCVCVSPSFCAADAGGAVYVSHLPFVLWMQAGKDRTGVIAALVLACTGATELQIVDDYARSVL